MQNMTKNVIRTYLKLLKLSELVDNGKNHQQPRPSASCWKSFLEFGAGRFGNLHDDQSVQQTNFGQSNILAEEICLKGNVEEKWNRLGKSY